MNEPIPIILHCPECGFQHIDKPETDEQYTVRLHESAWWELGGEKPPRWMNPPHATHRCLNCNALWRPSNHNTTGVETIPALEPKHLSVISKALHLVVHPTDDAVAVQAFKIIENISYKGLSGVPFGTEIKPFAVSLVRHFISTKKGRL
jgi:hypothetical protein